MNLTLRGIRIRRGSWTLQADGVFGPGIHLVTGAIGSGKTTLALILAGLCTPEDGSMEKQGIPAQMLVFQFPEVHVTGRTLRDEAVSWGVDAGPLLAAAGFSGRESADPLDLSRGELKRLILSCALARNADLLILDEPFGSLDCEEKLRLCTALSAREKGLTIIFTHEQSFFPRVDHLWEIQNGSLRYRGPVPRALSCWEQAPRIVRDLITRGRTPANLRPEDLREAACRT